MIIDTGIARSFVLLRDKIRALYSKVSVCKLRRGFHLRLGNDGNSQRCWPDHLRCVFLRISRENKESEISTLFPHHLSSVPTGNQLIMSFLSILTLWYHRPYLRMAPYRVRCAATFPNMKMRLLWKNCKLILTPFTFSNWTNE